MDFGSTILNNNNPLTTKIFFAKFDSSGNDNWVFSLGDTEDNWSKKINHDANQSIFITGTFNGSTIEFDPFNLTGNSNNTHTIFTAKLTDLNTSMPGINDDPLIQAFPNPNSGNFSILNKNMENLKITIQNLQGQIISYTESSHYTIDFTMKNAVPGVYIMNIESAFHTFRNIKIVTY